MTEVRWLEEIVDQIDANQVLADWQRMQDWVARHSMPADEPPREVLAERL